MWLQLHHTKRIFIFLYTASTQFLRQPRKCLWNCLVWVDLLDECTNFLTTNQHLHADKSKCQLFIITYSTAKVALMGEKFKNYNLHDSENSATVDAGNRHSVTLPNTNLVQSILQRCSTRYLYSSCTLVQIFSTDTRTQTSGTRTCE